MKYYIYVIFCMLTWGSLGIFVKNIPLDSVQISLARAIVGSLFLLVVYILQRNKLDMNNVKKYLPYLIYTGLAIGFNWVLLFEAYNYVPVSVATLTYYCAPAIVIIASPLVLKDKITPAKIIGVATAMVGMVMVNLQSLGGGSVKGVVFGLASAALYASVTLVNKKVKGFTGLEVTLIQLTCAGLVLIPYTMATSSAGQIFRIDFTGFVWLAVLCLFHTGVCYWLYFMSLQKMLAYSVAMLSFLDPVSALFFSAMFLNEKMTALQFAGAIIIIGGAMLCEIWQHKADKKLKTK
ncbi:MAG: EamA family transporter [Oscillospiraceae bacterium]|nr:EamA family transporter [Oscillospiraceae bacterium]